MRKEIIQASLVAAAAAFTISLAHAADPAGATGTPGAKPADVGKMFTQLDVDRDNSISKAEAQQNPDLSANFDKYDSNHDGKLDANEFAAAMSGGAQKK